MSQFETVKGSRKVITFSNDGRFYHSRLYVNNGETACHQNAEHKTEAGARKWADKILAKY